MTKKIEHPISARRSSGSALLIALALVLSASIAAVGQTSLGPTVIGQTNARQILDESMSRKHRKPNAVLEWNQIFIDTLIATNTANSLADLVLATDRASKRPQTGTFFGQHKSASACGVLH